MEEAWQAFAAQGGTTGAIAGLGLVAIGVTGQWGLGGALLKGVLQLGFWAIFLTVVWPAPAASALLLALFALLGHRQRSFWRPAAIAGTLGALPALVILAPQNPAWVGLLLSGTVALVAQTLQTETRLWQESYPEIETRLALGPGRRFA
ncbi:MAG: hypothetical protein HC918_12915, partial [Oscillatoriales cyanobacterium SM2_1_8]|nr:hypothetical protein [Oscillatoriales cyanobacterium SM2_1_8]